MSSLENKTESTPLESKEVESLENIKKKIENDAMEKVLNIYTQPIKMETIGQTLVGIMNEGATEFKEKTGRNMTYAEMREMYG
jgi:hypothetical protein